jgi:t-SNARE complex subunit (syntaxin)
MPAPVTMSQVALATTGDRETELSQEIQPLIAATNKKASIVKQLLQRLKEETDVLATSTETKQSDLRIRSNLVTTLTRKFVDVMKEYTNAQQKFKTDIKKKVKRQVQIVKPDATTEEIDAVMKGGGGSSDVFKSAILKGSAADPIRNAYMNVADKYQDVLTLEASVKELHQMFVDFALLTEQQGELLDQIEYQVKAASDYIDDANVELVQSIEFQKQIRKRQLCIFCILLVVIGVIILIIMAVTGNLK